MEVRTFALLRNMLFASVFRRTEEYVNFKKLFMKMESWGTGVKGCPAQRRTTDVVTWTWCQSISVQKMEVGTLRTSVQNVGQNTMVLGRSDTSFKSEQAQRRKREGSRIIFLGLLGRTRDASKVRGGHKRTEE